MGVLGRCMLYYAYTHDFLPMATQSPKKQPTIHHLASQDPVVYVIQAMIVAALVFAVSYVAYLIIFGRSVYDGAVLTTTEQQSQQVAVDELVEDGVDESEFFEGSVEGVVSTEAMQGLFPAIRE